MVFENFSNLYSKNSAWSSGPGLWNFQRNCHNFQLLGNKGSKVSQKTFNCYHKPIIKRIASLIASKSIFNEKSLKKTYQIPLFFKQRIRKRSDRRGSVPRMSVMSCTRSNRGEILSKGRHRRESVVSFLSSFLVLLLYPVYLKIKKNLSLLKDS